MILSEVNDLLENAIKELDAISCTFYIRDPFWTDELRLVSMPGVKFVEPMHGFTFPTRPRGILADKDIEFFCEDTDIDADFRNNELKQLESIPEDKRSWFGDFIEREGVKSFAKLTKQSGEKIEAVLFVNFNKHTVVDSQLKAQIREIFGKLTSDLERLRKEIKEIDLKGASMAMRIFSRTNDGTNSSLYEWDQPLEKYLNTLLHTLIEKVFRLEIGKAFGMIHIYDKHSNTLQMTVQVGSDRKVTTARPLSVEKGEGVISWVAVRQNALLISDLETSKFSEIFDEFNQGIRSEVAIPIFLGEDLLGVLNLESIEPNAFDPVCVRSLWFAVNHVALAHKHSYQEDLHSKLKSLSDGLLKLYEEGVKSGSPNSLDNLATLIRNQLDAAQCEIWHYNPNKNEFELSGISHKHFIPEPPRDNGWSNYVRTNIQPIWLSKVISEKNFSCLIWDNKNNQWSQLDEKDEIEIH